jgi:hypothetical protein
MTTLSAWQEINIGFLTLYSTITTASNYCKGLLSEKKEETENSFKPSIHDMQDFFLHNLVGIFYVVLFASIHYFYTELYRKNEHSDIKDVAV